MTTQGPPYYWCGEGPYWHEPPQERICCSTHGMDLPTDLHRLAVAVHEAGHAVTAFERGVHIPSVGIDIAVRNLACGTVEDVTGSCDEVDFNGSTAGAVLTVLAAGEQAELRWLSEIGLSNPKRTFFAERGGLADRAAASRLLQSNYQVPLTFGTGADTPDWWRYREEARRVIEQQWDRILRLSVALRDAGRLSGDDAAEVCGLRNTPPVPH